MNQSELSNLQHRVAQASENPNKARRYPNSLTKDVVDFIQRQPEELSMSKWGALFQVSSGTVARWVRVHSSGEIELSKPWAPESSVPGFTRIAVGAELNSPPDSNRVTLSVGHGQVELTLEQLSYLLTSKEVAVC